MCLKILPFLRYSKAKKCKADNDDDVFYIKYDEVILYL